MAIARAAVLLTDGVYRWSRNPICFAMAAPLGAIAGSAAQPWLLIGPVAFVAVITGFQIPPGKQAAQGLTSVNVVEHAGSVETAAGTRPATNSTCGTPALDRLRGMTECAKRPLGDGEIANGRG